MHPETNGKDIPSLTGVRFIAVSCVFLIHYIHKFNFAGDFAQGLINQMFLSLHVFFVLSGFVICYKYYDHSAINKNFLWKYYLRRFSKIYPVFFLLTTFTYLVWSVNNTGQRELLKEYLLNISFLKGFSENYYLTGIGPAWSLTVEEFFYFLSPFIFLFIKRKNIFFPQVFFWWTTGVLVVLFFSIFPVDGFFKDAYFVFFTTFFGRCFEFYCGILLALYIMGRKNILGIKPPQFKTPVYTLSGFLWMLAIVLLLYLAQVNVADGYLTIRILLANLVFPVGVIIFFYGLITESSVTKRIFASKPFQLLGKSSYSFFLVHTGVLAAGLEKYITQNVLFLYLVLYSVSILLFLLFERPISQWIRNKTVL